MHEFIEITGGMVLNAVERERAVRWQGWMVKGIFLVIQVVSRLVELVPLVFAAFVLGK